MKLITEPKAIWHKVTRLDGTDAWRCYIAYPFPKPRKYLRSFDDFDEMQVAAAKFLATGERPAPRGKPISKNTKIRHATIKPMRRTENGTLRYDIRGRVGYGDEAVYIHVASCSTMTLAKARAAEFESTGKVWTGEGNRSFTTNPRRPVGQKAERQTTIKPQIIVRRETEAPNPWAARYSSYK